MILGIGTDIVQIPRVHGLLQKFGERFINKILTGNELARYSQIPEEQKANFLAKRFAAKEAVAKAFGTGIGESIKFHDIIISNDDLGKPEAKVSSLAAKDKNIFLSIADDHPTAVAFAVVSE